MTKPPRDAAAHSSYDSQEAGECFSTDTFCARAERSSQADGIACANISFIMASGRPSLFLSRFLFLFLFVLIGSPAIAGSTTLEDSAKEFAGKIAAGLTTRENVSCEVRNLSSLQSGDVARIERTLKLELQSQGVQLSIGVTSAVSIAITLAENLNGFVWTGEIREGNASRVILLAVSGSSEVPVSSGVMPVILRSQKFWEGPQHILDAADISDGSGKSQIVLLLPDRLMIQDMQSGATRNVAIPAGGIPSRDPRGQFGPERSGNAISFLLHAHKCYAGLETGLIDCQPWASPIEADGSSIPPGCGVGNARYLAQGGGDYTQTDSLQAFRTEPHGPTPVSAELEFPGPILALYAGLDGPRVILRNLKTGNYEAHRLSITCAQ